MNLSECVKSRNLDILERALANSNSILKSSNKIVDEFFVEQADVSYLKDHLCFAAVGSVGRREALEASDLDVIPVADTEAHIETYMSLDAELRGFLSERLNLKVSKGEDLTRPTSIERLTEVEAIGGSHDDRSALTKRVLLLTESASAGGNYPIKQLRRAIVGAYAGESRTSGRHVLSLCNDVARYFKTLCIEYKAKIEEEEKDWCTRNMKLRHSRKVWYFANIMAVSDLANKFPTGDDDFKDAPLDAFDSSPTDRLVAALADSQPLGLGRLLEAYALFLDFMSKTENRAALSCTEHDARYAMNLENPFPAMKFNSDLIHSEIMSIIEELGPAARSRIVSWFML